MMHIAYGLGDVGRALKKMGLVVFSFTLFIAFIFFMMCSPPTSVASEYRSNYEKIPAVNKFPIQVGKWARTPTVIVCTHTPVSETQIKSSVAFWKRLGHRFFRTQYKYDPLNKCLEHSPLGYIVIHLVSQDIKLAPTALAETHFFVDNDTGEISWAIIYVRSTIPETVLEHELGHALGYLHYDKINHLMNSKWTQGGWDTDGLKKN